MSRRIAEQQTRRRNPGGTSGGTSLLDLVLSYTHRCVYKFSESLAGIEVLRDYARLCVSVRFGLEWIKRALLYQLSYAPTVISI